MNKALILTNGLLTTNDAKTAHGLIRGTERYEIVGVIDPPTAGRDAGEVLDGKKRDIPIFDSLQIAVKQLQKVDYLIIGVATVGGVLPTDMLDVIISAIKLRISIVNGLHEYLNEKPDIVALATEYTVQLIDVRKPKARKDLHFWTGEIYDVTAPIIAVIGMDCALGKRTTARMVRQACEADGINAQMIYTGQTGWLQGGKYGFIFDSTLNDFVSGEVENAIVSCWKETGADLILIEGQSSLRNPSGPCGLEFLISGNAKHVILVHAPKRRYFDNEPHWGEIPSVASEVEIIEKFGAKVMALALNTEECTAQEALNYQRYYEEELQIPVLLPLEEGVGKLLPALKELIGLTTEY
ncbi:DUF1611 domain-containing protein [Runella slithyformis]|uniref:DUF1611 domain-containing protein n=1 Tax=Runella slithyformis (strain ATCC 29530 / DSM 19594 / LMG 11500 / NCIMB 11436 / LSU 4) TaxID=761193 RepID=A0A7U3ZG91_RUNSL|nr:DUF1611 domain-containing protein [Runella slithyformis]AEI46666.1 protein of unknown function DUF1611 [Runella slithyformis DSM 19594]